MDKSHRIVGKGKMWLTKYAARGSRDRSKRCRRKVRRGRWRYEHDLDLGLPQSARLTECLGVRVAEQDATAAILIPKRSNILRRREKISGIELRTAHGSKIRAHERLRDQASDDAPKKIVC